MTPSEYWRSGMGMSHITPAGLLWPEGYGFPAFLADLVGSSSVLEIGCGPGRLAALFSAEQYMGVDICPEALEMARKALPEHSFALLADEDEELPLAGVTLVYTVLLHIPDDEIDAMIGRFHSLRVLVGEILGREWRREGLPPVFNREAKDYEARFAPRYRLMHHHRHSYRRYREGTEVSILEFVQ